MNGRFRDRRVLSVLFLFVAGLGAVIGVTAAATPSGGGGNGPPVFEATGQPLYSGLVDLRVGETFQLGMPLYVAKPRYVAILDGAPLQLPLPPHVHLVGGAAVKEAFGAFRDWPLKPTDPRHSQFPSRPIPGSLLQYSGDHWVSVMYSFTADRPGLYIIGLINVSGRARLRPGGPWVHFVDPLNNRYFFCVGATSKGKTDAEFKSAIQKTCGKVPPKGF